MKEYVPGEVLVRKICSFFRWSMNIQKLFLMSTKTCSYKLLGIGVNILVVITQNKFFQKFSKKILDLNLKLNKHTAPTSDLNDKLLAISLQVNWNLGTKGRSRIPNSSGNVGALHGLKSILTCRLFFPGWGGVDICPNCAVLAAYFLLNTFII